MRRLDPREWTGMARGAFLGALALVLSVVPLGPVILRVVETLIPDPEIKRLQKSEAELRERLYGSGRWERYRQEAEDREKARRLGARL
jgi:hypothetical protein